MAVDQNETGGKPSDHDEIISFLKLRNFIGLAGISLPFLLVVGSSFFGPADDVWQSSISHYYYTKMHIVFIGTLCVLGGFLITYQGKTIWESRVSNFAGFCAFAISAFPTALQTAVSPNKISHQYITVVPAVGPFWSNVHYLVATLLFVCFIIFCFVFFQHADEEHTTEEAATKFQRRKKLYRICGYGIAVSMLAIGIFTFFVDNKEGWLGYTTLIFETTALEFFGVAWLVKGSKYWPNYSVLKTVIGHWR